MLGVIVWGSIVIINLVILLVLQLIRKSRVVPTMDVFLAALISDVLVHFLVALTSNFGEMIMWTIISFPIVAVVSLFTCFLAKKVYDYWRARQDVLGSKDTRNT